MGANLMKPIFLNADNFGIGTTLAMEIITQTSTNIKQTNAMKKVQNSDVGGGSDIIEPSFWKYF